MNRGGIGRPVSTEMIIRRLRLMADSGGMLTRDRIRLLIEAADRLEAYEDERHIVIGLTSSGGDAGEKH